MPLSLNHRFCIPMANFSWLHMMRLLALASLFCINLVSCSTYHDRCGSIVPESKPTDPELTTIPFPPNQDGYYLGGDEVLKYQGSSRFYYSSTNRKGLLFRTHKVYRTTADGVYKVEASLILQPSRITHIFSDSSVTFSSWSQDGALSFEIEGFWSKPTGKLCMLGSGSTKSEEGKHYDFSALLKLSDVRSPSNITSLIRGTLESLSPADDSSYFKPISLLMFPLMDYKYTEVAKGSDYGCSGDSDVAKSSLALPLSFSFCSVFSQGNSFPLQYTNECSSSKNCNPLGDNEGDLPQVMSFSSFQCSDDSRSVRLLVEFTNSSFNSYYTPFNPNKTLVAEGSWSSLKNQLCVVACKISTPTDSLDSSQVEDCSARLSLRFPAVLSINSTSKMVGIIWSNKTAGVSGHFDNITFSSYRSDTVGIPGLKYEYTQIDKAIKACPKKPKEGDGKQYPDGNSYDMNFHISLRSRKFRKLYGYADLVSVGDKMVFRNSFSMSRLSKVKKNLQPMNVSYRMSMTSYNASSKNYEGFLISAEGVYDPQTGALCMVGCKSLETYARYDQIPTNDSMDCEVIVDIQFPPLDSGGRIKGRIGSTREKSSPQYFESLSFSAVPYFSHGRSIWRMDLEIIMALISNTLVCIFIACQIWYSKKHPNVYPFISLLMLVILTLGHMIPLVLNFEALFFSKQNSQSYVTSAGGWLEVNEVIVRVVTMVAFLLQVRLLLLVLSARLANENQKAFWIAERKTLYISLPLYIAGALIALSINWKSYHFGQDRMNYAYVDSEQHSLWMDLRSYGGLVLDGFLLPQIILNIFHNSRENVLAYVFYIGTTLVRVLPHAYDLFRAYFFVDGLEWSYMYANPAGDYYSTAWDVMIPAGCLLLCGIVYIQQRFGGRCFLPKMLKETAAYEKVPVADEM